MQIEVSKEEAAAIINIFHRAQITGQEAETVVYLKQKFAQALQAEPLKQEEKKEEKKNGK